MINPHLYTLPRAEAVAAHLEYAVKCLEQIQEMDTGVTYGHVIEILRECAAEVKNSETVLRGAKCFS